MKHEKKIIAIICIVLSILPFLWFKPGEVNFGGDSSRLYFYDPANYLKNVALYNIAPGETGYEVISYFYIPFTLLLLILKTVFYTPYLLNTAYTSIEIVVAFLFTYLCITELLKGVKKEVGLWEQLACILGSFVYLFSPTVNHWNAALITQNQIFLNPLVFYLALRFIHTQKMIYALVALLITVLFAPNFSFASAPNFFAFYPFSLLFLFVYALWVRRITIHWKKITLIFLLFIGLHAFHLVPQITVFFNTESSEYKRVFASGEAAAFKVDEGLKLSNNLMSMKQEAGVSELYMVIVPMVVIMGLLLQSRQHKGDGMFKRTFLLLSMFFLMVLYLDTANITPVLARIFELLFRIPGFIMFRNYYGQFLYVFYFFYALLFAFSLSVILTSTPKNWKHLVSVLFTLVLIVNGWKFLSGQMERIPIFGSKDISIPFKIDPNFEETLNFIREGTTDGKYLTLPLTLFGYQLLGGVEGGMYLGPSMIGYLTDKKDFTGYQGLAPFNDLFFSFASEGDYKGVQMILSWLNIRYFFHNEDPYIYDSFTQFPYSVGYVANMSSGLYGIKRFFPDQSSIKDFLKKLDTKLVYNKGSFSIYENDFYLPLIYVSKKNIQTQGFQNNWRFPIETNDNDLRIAFYETAPPQIPKGDMVINVPREGLINNPSQIPYKLVSSVEGEYEVYAKHNFLNEVDKTSTYIEIGDQKLQFVEEATNSSWIRFNNARIKDPSLLLFTTKNSKPPLKPSWNVNETQNGTIAQTMLESWSPLRQYLISFEYNSQEPLYFRLFENLEVHGEEKPIINIEQPLNSSGWSRYQNVIRAAPNATSGNVQFIGKNQQAIESSIRNFSIVEIFQPEIVLRKVNASTATQTIPQITFTRINPAKYLVEIKNATDPYTLVFLSAFNKKWKLFLSHSNIFPSIDRAKTYFNGDIREGSHGNTFLNNRTFETFWKTPIADRSHFVANGYANSWNISPADVSGKTDYILILEMTRQRNFYIPLFISVILASVCGSYVVILLARSYKGK